VQHVAACCSVLKCVLVWCNVLQCVAMCCSVLQCVALCCSVLQFEVFEEAEDQRVIDEKDRI